MPTKFNLILLITTVIFSLTFISLPALAQLSPELLEGDTAEEHLDQSEAFLEAAGLRPVHPSILVAQIIKALLAILGVVFIVLIIYAGFRWMTSAGNEDSISKAKKTITAAVIGLVIILSAYLITAFILSQLLEATEISY